MSKAESTVVATRILRPFMMPQEAQTLLDGNTLPPRSRLYGMEPCGEGLWSESLTSYLNRLGWRHGVSPRWLVAQEVLPRLSDDHFPPLANFCLQRAMNLNGNGPLAQEWAALLEQLTGRSDLHLLTASCWIGDLSDRGHLRTVPAWCPLCYKEWKEQGSPIYQPQIWMFRVVTMCPRHHKRLEDRCPHCHKTQPFISTQKSRLGECTRCVGWLDTETDTQSDKLSDEDRHWQEWVIHALEEMHVASLSFQPFQWERFFASLATCFQEPGGQRKLARLTGIDKACFSRWRSKTSVPHTHTSSQPSYIPSLESIFRFCYACDVTPLQTMTNHLDSFQVILKKGTSSRPPRPCRPAPDRLNHEDCLKLVNAILDGREEPLSLHQIAKHYGCDVRTLLRHFPQECPFITQRAQRSRKQRGEERLRQICEQVRQTVITLHSQGFYPSYRRLRKLFPPGIMHTPEANVAWHDTLRELGLE